MNEKQYNGWTNYETWLLALWIDNEQGSHGYWRERAAEILDESEGDKIFSKVDRAKLDLSKALKEEIEEANPVQDNGFFCDLMTSALQSVNYYEIASNWIDEIYQQESEVA